MNNIEKLNAIFVEIFSTDESLLNAEFTNTNIEGWDSIRHLSLTAQIEDEFDIMFDPEDIIELTSYNRAKQILSSKYDIDF